MFANRPPLVQLVPAAVQHVFAAFVEQPTPHTCVCAPPLRSDVGQVAHRTVIVNFGTRPPNRVFFFSYYRYFFVRRERFASISLRPTRPTFIRRLCCPVVSWLYKTRTRSRGSSIGRAEEQRSSLPWCRLSVFCCYLLQRHSSLVDSLIRLITMKAARCS